MENAVKLLYRSVYADIEGLVFNSLESLNAAISESLSAFNERKMSGRPQSRREQFEQIESDCLRPLPAMRHQMKERRSATVMRNSYVTFRLHHYSVPKEYIGKRVDIVYDADTLEIYHGLRLVTTHQRDDTPYAYTTKDAHGLLDAMEVTKKTWNRSTNEPAKRPMSCCCICARWQNSRSTLPQRSVHARESWHWRRPSDWSGWWRQARAPRNCANTDIRK